MKKITNIEMEWIEDIAKRSFFTVNTLKKRNSYDLDFHKVGVLEIQNALTEAYLLGKSEGFLDGVSESEAYIDEMKSLIY